MANIPARKKCECKKKIWKSAIYSRVNNSSRKGTRLRAIGITIHNEMKFALIILDSDMHT